MQECQELRQNEALPGGTKETFLPPYEQNFLKKKVLCERRGKRSKFYAKNEVNIQSCNIEWICFIKSISREKSSAVLYFL